MRLMGATAIYYRCPNSRSIIDVMNRPLTDLDFVTSSKYVRHIPDFFANLGYEGNDRVNALFGLRRQIYTDARSRRHVDVFVDKLSFCHQIDLTDRLEVDPITLGLADLLLEKMQIVKMNEKDAKDSVILLLNHDLSDHDGDDINAGYIATLLAADWGFYYTVTTNLKKTAEYADSLTILDSEQKNVIRTRIHSLLERIERQNKSLGWKVRARIGTSKKWYDDPEDVENRELAGRKEG